MSCHVMSPGEGKVEHHNSNPSILNGRLYGHRYDLHSIGNKILQIQKRFAHLRSGHPGEEGSPPAQSVAAQAEQRPGEEVPPRHQVEEEDVHDQTHLS